ncbi:unnamed protein product [Hymenolepis diminuta]|uniref:Uncharacterized protein n=1 Tax=Hymenolepis diminuta TaxID=6216 RepID=A0A564YRF3_HYMDI|nr:unnamed protein product [Hymenolepis diminuta]
MEQSTKHLKRILGQSDIFIPKLCPDSLVSQACLISLENSVGLLFSDETKKLILLKELDDSKFKEAVSILRELFGEKSSGFRKCFKYLTLAMRSDEDWINYVTQTSENFEQPDLKSISNDHSSALRSLAVCGIPHMWMSM